eukprot:363692-Chlamydomonas_euryale.AAC.1
MPLAADAPVRAPPPLPQQQCFADGTGGDMASSSGAAAAAPPPPPDSGLHERADVQADTEAQLQALRDECNALAERLLHAGVVWSVGTRVGEGSVAVNNAACRCGVWAPGW